MQAIIEEAGSEDLEALDTANDEDDKDEDLTIPDCGIYLARPEARQATEISPADLKKSKMPAEQGEERSPRHAQGRSRNLG